MIRRVKIKDYKSLKNVEVELQPLTVIMGPNAAGKSNLFDALRLLSHVCTKRSLNEAFEEHRGAPLEAFFYSGDGVSGLLKESVAQFSIEVDVELSEESIDRVERQIQQMREGLTSRETNGKTPKRKIHHRFLRYSLTVEIQTDSGHLRVVDECLKALNKDGTERKSRSPFIEKGKGKLHLRMEGQAHPIYHDIGLNYTLASDSLYQPHYPHICAFKEELSRWHFYYFDPKSMRADTPLKEVDSIGTYGADLAAFYYSLKMEHPKQFSILSRALRSLLPSVDAFDVERTPEGYLQLKIMEDNVSFSSRVISEGTLRILGLLAITSRLSSATVIGYEEPENGVHPRRLKLMTDLLKNAVEYGGIQIIVNTHSPILPTYFDDDEIIVCRKERRETEFIPCISFLPLFRKKEIDEALEGEEKLTSREITSLMERIVRGDFGG